MQDGDSCSFRKKEFFDITLELLFPEYSFVINIGWIETKCDKNEDSLPVSLESTGNLMETRYQAENFEPILSRLTELQSNMEEMVNKQEAFIQRAILQYELSDFPYNAAEDEITRVEDNRQESKSYHCNIPQLTSNFKKITGGFKGKNQYPLISFFLLMLWIGFGSAAGLIKLSNCSSPLTHCPVASNVCGFRELCINSRTGVCPEGSTYICGIDTEKRYIIETCQEIKECWPGTTFAYEVQKNASEVILSCVPCQGDRFETEYRLSSMSCYTGKCTYQHKDRDSISKHLVLIREGTKASETVWRCDAEGGFYEINGWMTCDDKPSHPCTCLGKSCLLGYKLRPDGECIRCHTKLDPNDDWRCKDDINWFNTTFVPLVTSVASSLNTTHSNEKMTSVSIENITDSEVPENRTSLIGENVAYTKSGDAGVTNEMVLVFCIIILVFLVVAAIVFLLVRCFRTRQSAGHCPNSLESQHRNGTTVHKKLNKCTINKHILKIKAKTLNLEKGKISNYQSSAKKSSKQGRKGTENEEMNPSLDPHLRMKTFPSTPLLGKEDDDGLTRNHGENTVPKTVVV